MSVTTDPAVPSWTEPSYRNEGGRDHLGMAGVLTGQVLPALSPRVVAVTVHPRYLSFYTWLLWEFWESDLDKDSALWSRFEKTHESLFSIGAAGGLCSRPEHDTVEGGIVGSNTTTSVARTGGPYTLPVDFLGNRQGGYGAQYAGVVSGAGLTIPAWEDDRLDVDALTPRGVELARRFRETVADTVYVTELLHAEPPVVCDETVAGEFMRRACVCQLRTDAGTERNTLRAALLHDDGQSDDHRRQLATFALYVELGRQTDGTLVDEQTFRELVYFRSSDGLAFVPPAPLVEVTRHWRLVQLREYLSFVLNRLWQWTVEWSRGWPGDTVPITAIIDAASAALDAAPPHGSLGLATWSAAALEAAEAVGPDGADADTAWARTPADEQSLQDRARELSWDDPAVVPVCMQLLTLVMARVRSWPTGPVDVELLDAGGTDRASLRTIAAAWRQWGDQGLSAADATAELLRRFIIDQHIRTAYAKLPRIDSLRFSREGLHLRIHDQDAEIASGGVRFGSNSTVAHELGYTGAFHQPNHAPTDDGLALLDEFAEQP